MGKVAAAVSAALLLAGNAAALDPIVMKVRRVNPVRPNTAGC